jgi:purine-nucleoside phosphorylase
MAPGSKYRKVIKTSSKLIPIFKIPKAKLMRVFNKLAGIAGTCVLLADHCRKILMDNFIIKIEEAAGFLKERGMVSPETAIIMGTGLGNLANRINIEVAIDYANIPYFPVSTVESHHGRLIYGMLAGKKVLAMQGRFHYYEGYSMKQITFPVRVMKALGVKQLLISNACGSMNPAFQKGSLMLIADHINLLNDNPLIGHNPDELGPRFPDMGRAYSPELNERLLAAAAKAGIKMHQGVYAALAGPNLETAAEYRYLSRIGADVVGMSTVPEVMAAHHAGLPVAAISVITDECDPDYLVPVKLQELLEVAALAETDLDKIFTEVVAGL